MAIGVLWAPFAAVLCFNKAEAIGLPSIRYALMGALYSVLFLMPLIYLSARMDGKRVPRGLVILAYFVLYGCICMAGAAVGLSFVVNFLLDLVNGAVSGFGKSMIPISVYSVFMISMILTLLIHIKAPPDSSAKGFRESLPAFPYVLPFVLAFGWLALSVVVLLLG